MFSFPLKSTIFSMGTNIGKIISLGEKVDIICDLEKGDANSQVCKKCNLSMSAFTAIFIIQRNIWDIKLNSVKPTSI